MGFVKHCQTKYKSKLTKEIRVLGIDLGTTNSTAAEVNWAPGSTPAYKILEIDQPTREGLFTSPLVPSAAAIPPGKMLWVGEGPKRLCAFLQESNLSFEKNLFYDTKNEMGLRKTYFRAPESFNRASKIAGYILAFLKEGAEKANGKKYEYISVTVPSSFELNQRCDTLHYIPEKHSLKRIFAANAGFFCPALRLHADIKPLDFLLREIPIS